MHLSLNAITLAYLSSLLCFSNAYGDDWPQAAGPNANWKVAGSATVHWSAAENKNIKWRTTLPEGGQSSLTVWRDRGFLTTYRPLQSSDQAQTNTDIVGYCLDLANGAILWTVELPGTVSLGTAGVFSDTTVFAPITDGERVWFFNRGGSVGCYDLNGQQIWLRHYKPRTRHANREAEPVLWQNQLLVVEVLDKAATLEIKRDDPVPAGVDSKPIWTYIHGLDASTGKVLWVENSGTVIHNTPMIGQLSNGEWAVLHARGGPHSPLEVPYGLTLTSLAPGRAGTPLWSKQMTRINPMVNNHWDAQRSYAFDGSDHVVLDTNTGRELSRQNIRTKVDRWSYVPGSDARKLLRGVDLPGKKPRLITYHTNIVVGAWHYFLAHEISAVGRVHLDSGKVEYLDVPYQVAVFPNGSRKLIWEASAAVPIGVENSRGVSLMSDKRSTGTGWGHVSAASPILVGQYLYFPIMNGTVYVIDTQAAEFSEKALVALNDLGPAGTTWTLSSLSYVDSHLYARTLKEVFCIGD